MSCVLFIASDCLPLLSDDRSHGSLWGPQDCVANFAEQSGRSASYLHVNIHCGVDHTLSLAPVSHQGHIRDTSETAVTSYAQ